MTEPVRLSLAVYLVAMVLATGQVRAGGTDPACAQLLAFEQLNQRAALLAEAPLDNLSTVVFRRAISLASDAGGAAGPSARNAALESLGRRIIAMNDAVLDMALAGDRDGIENLVNSQGWRGAGADIVREKHNRSCDSDAAAETSSKSAPNGSSAVRKPPNSRSDVLASARAMAARPATVWSLLAIGAAVPLIYLLARLNRSLRRRRQAKRHRCFIAAAMRGHLYCEKTEILDISEFGGKVRLYDSLDRAHPVSLHFGDRVMHGKIVWDNPHYAGVEFAMPLTAAQLSQILSDSRKRPRSGAKGFIPSLPCHGPGCSKTCAEHRDYQRIKNDVRAGPQGSAGLNSKGRSPGTA